MRILVATAYLPWPLDSGGGAAQIATLNCLSSDHQFTLLAPVFRRTDLAATAKLQPILPNVRLRPIFCGDPRNTSSIRTAATKVVRFGQRIFDGKRTSGDSTTAGLLYNPFLPLPEALVNAVEEEIGEGFDLFQAEFAPMMQLGSFIPGGIPKLFIHHQLHSVYVKRAIAVGGGNNPYFRYLESIMRTQELTYLRDFDAIVTFSDSDRESLLPSLPETKLFTSPFPIPPDIRLNSSASETWDGRYVFLASEIHPPNRDALEWLMSQIWPRIAGKLPSCTLHVIGNWASKRRKRYASQRVHFDGFVSDLQGALAHSIALVPIRVGSGIRVKILAAMASGAPVISTTVGCEGIPIVDGLNISLADEAESFVSAALKLGTDPVLRKQMASAGAELVSTYYSPESVRQRRNQIYKEVSHRACS